MNPQSLDSVPTMSAATAMAVVDRAATLGAASMPLPAGLRAAAAEADSWQLARALRGVASELERGRPLDDLLTSSSHHLPPHLAGLVRAAQHSGDFGPMVAAWLENRRAARQHWHAMMAALAYPLITALCALFVFVVFAWLSVGTFKTMFDEFGLKLPVLTTHFLWLCEMVLHVVLPLVCVLAVAAIAIWLFGGRVGWPWVMTNLPLVGKNWHWTGVAEMLRCLGLLIERRVPVPEALRLTADGIADGYVALQCRRLATSVEQGTSLTMSLVNLRTLPLSIAPLVRWGEQHDLLSESLRSAAEMLEGRLALRTDMLMQILPPIIFLMIGVMIGSGVFALFLPLISLIQGPS